MARCSLLVLLVLLVLLAAVGSGPVTNLHPDMADQQLFWGSDQYDFSMVLAAGGHDCFWHFAHKGEHFYLHFMVQWVTGVGHDRHLSVSVNAPSSLLLSTLDEASGQIGFQAEETGFYQMCFDNFHNRFGTMQISLSFGVYYDGSAHKEVEKKKQEEVSRDLNNTLDAIEETSHRVENYVFHMFRYYAFGRMKRGSDHFLLQSSAHYVTWWSAAQSVAIVAAGFLQLLFLRRLFSSKTEGGAEEQRC